MWAAVIASRTITCAHMWRIPHARLSFFIRATDDTRNLHVCLGAEESSNPSLQRLLSGCKVSLSQGRHRCQHYQVLHKLVETLKDWRQTRPVRNHSSGSSLYYEGEKREWNMTVDLD